REQRTRAIVTDGAGACAPDALRRAIGDDEPAGACVRDASDGKRAAKPNSHAKTVRRYSLFLRATRSLHAASQLRSANEDVMKAANYRHWFEDEEVTVEITPLGAISTPAVALVETEPLVTARQLLVDQRVPAIAVVDDTGSLRGVLTRTDVLRGLAKAPDARVGDAMSGFVLALSRYARVEQAAALM